MAFWSFTKNPKIYDYKSSCIHKYDKIVTKYLLYRIQIPAYFIQNILTKLAQITWYTKFINLTSYFEIKKSNQDKTIKSSKYMIQNKLTQITWYTKLEYLSWHKLYGILDLDS